MTIKKPIKPGNIICPSCQDGNAYQGFMHVECPNSSCKYYTEAQKMLLEQYQVEQDSYNESVEKTSDSEKDERKTDPYYGMRNSSNPATPNNGSVYNHNPYDPYDPQGFYTYSINDDDDSGDTDDQSLSSWDNGGSYDDDGFNGLM